MNPVLDRSESAQLSFLLPAERVSHRALPAAHQHFDPALLISPQSSAAAIDLYRQAAANLFPAKDPEAARPGAARSESAIFITSPHHGDGKTCTAFNLAWTLAQSNQDVLLAELNFVHPRLSAALGDPHLRLGLESALRGTAAPADTVFSISGTSLYLAAVRNPTPLAELVPIQANLHKFLKWASANFDRIVLDCPSVLSRQWSGWFAHHAAPALLVTRANHTPRIEIQRAVKSLGPALHGVLMNAVHGAPPQLAEGSPVRRLSPHVLQPNISDYPTLERK